MMKKMLAIAVLAVLALVSACGDDDEASLIGTWETTMEGSRMALSFAAATFEALVYDSAGAKTHGRKGTYTCSSNKLFMVQTHIWKANTSMWEALESPEITTNTYSLSGRILVLEIGVGTAAFTKK